MDPTVMAAAIGVGGTVIVGTAGFSAALIGTRKTIRAARDSKLWDKRADVYVDVLAAVHYRQVRRAHDMQAIRTDQSERQYAADVAAYAPPDWHLLDARLQAFGTEPVFTAVQASSAAHEHAIAALRARSAAVETDLAQRAQPGGPPQGPTAANSGLSEAAEKARKAADDADDALGEVIRAGLQGKSRSLGQWESLSAKQVTKT